MNKQPVSYLQIDARWKNTDYSTTGEKTTIGASGCGPTAAAMLIETLTGKPFTPKDACAWALKRGYKAANQGTYHSYFVPQFAAYGITCKRLNTSRIGGNAAAAIHEEAIKLMKEGWYLIALMGKGLWTSSGHYIVVWWADDKFHINDPASTKAARLNGDPFLFRSQCKYYWAIDARKYNNQEDDGMASTTEEEKMDNSPADWEKDGVEWAAENKLMFGNKVGNLKLHSNLTRAEFCVMLKRYHENRDSIV